MRRVSFPFTVAGSIVIVRATVHEARPSTRYEPAEPPHAEIVDARTRGNVRVDLETLDIDALEARAFEIADGYALEAAGCAL
jgi:hypothetical protein